MVADGPRVRPFADGDLEGFLRVKCAAFEGTRIENERRRWRVEFDANPAAPAPFPRAFVAEADGAIVGGIVLLPCRVQVGGSIVVGAYGMDLCVEARLRGRGLGRELLRRWLDPSLAPFAFSVSTVAAALAHARSFGASILEGEGGPVAWVRHDDDAHAAPPARELLETETPADLPPDTDELDERSRAGQRLVFVRDAAYLRWRWRDIPSRGVTMIRAVARGATRGLAFLQDDADQGACFVADLLCAPEDDAARRSLLRRALAVARSLRCNVLWYLTRDPAAAPALREEGFGVFEGPRPKFISKLNLAPSDAPAGRTGPVRADEWAPSAGDGDLLFRFSEPRDAANVR
jgi:GNAT superfamily N-acetyltransferase